MRLTARGWLVVAVVGFAVAMSWRYGPRALNAVVTPLLVTLIAGVIATARAERPTVRRRPVDDGFISETRTVEIEIETTGSTAANVRDDVDDGLSATGADARTTLEGETRFSYDATLEARGKQRVGPLSIAVTDVLGLFERRFEYPETTTVLVYPRVDELGGESTRELRSVADAATEHRRDEFDHLREYQRGDSLRDVHWKSAAKQPGDDLVVKEFVTDESAGSATVAGECIPGREDELAAATASVATYLLELDVGVGVEVATESQPPGAGHDHHRALLELLAVVEAGELEPRVRAQADVLVQADANGTRVIVDDRVIPFDRLRGETGGSGSRDGSRDRDGGPGGSREVAA